MSDIRNDQEVAVIEKQIEPMREKVDSLIIVDERTSKVASDMKEFIKKAWKQLEERRKFFVGPLNDHIKTINNEFKALMQPLEEMEDTLKSKLMSYFEMARKVQAEKEAAKQAELDKIAESNGLEKVEVKTEPVRTVVSSLGKTFTRKVWKWRVSDERKIPKEYWILDTMKLNSMVRAFTKTIDGVNQCSLKIDGIEVYQEESVV